MNKVEILATEEGMKILTQLFDALLKSQGVVGYNLMQQALPSIKQVSVLPIEEPITQPINE